MPPRHKYWTIILEGKPTAFRAGTDEELLPTLKQLQSRHPDAVLRWYARGRLWHSPEEERLAQAARAKRREGRGPDWRPGGTHEDPRARFKIPRDEKRRRFRDRLSRDRKAPGEGPPTGAPPKEGERPRGSWKPPGRPPRPANRDWNRRDTPAGPRDPSTGRHGPSAGQRGPSGERRGPSGERRGPASGQRGPSTGHRGPASGQRGPSGGYRGPSGGYRGPSDGRRGPSGGRRNPSRPPGGGGKKGGGGGSSR